MLGCDPLVSTQVFDMRAVVVSTGVLLDSQDRRTASQHFSHALNFYLTQTTALHEIGSGLVGRE